jgi:hypothetical protein
MFRIVEVFEALVVGSINVATFFFIFIVIVYRVEQFC